MVALGSCNASKITRTAEPLLFSLFILVRADSGFDF